MGDIFYKATTQKMIPLGSACPDAADNRLLLPMI